MAKKEFEYEYDPVKYAKDGKEAEKVIWTTKSLEAAVKALNEGLPLKANPFLGKNTKLLKPDLLYKRTEQELDDYVRCMQDPLYFAAKCYLMTPNGLEPCVLRDYQEDYLNHVKNNRFSIFLSCRQSGKSTTTAIACLWKILFNTDKSALILSKSAAAGNDLLEKIKQMYMYLPYYLKCGTLKWNQGSISFDNNSSISTEAFSPTAGLGKTINFLILDEFAWCPPNEVELFYNNIIPTVTTITDSNVCIMSTQNGFNLFYRLWKGAIEKKNIYAPFKVDWHQVPQYNPKTKQWEKRTMQWKETMVGVLGSEEAFQYQYGTAFSASDRCLVNRETLAKIRANTVLFENRNDLDIILAHKDCLYWDPHFDLEQLNTGYFIVFVDLAEGGGGDSTVFNIFQLSDNGVLTQVGVWRSNKVDLENAALEFWLLAMQLFNDNRRLVSIEWNTYGALFYQLISNYNDNDYSPETSWRWNVCNTGGDIDGFDLTHIIKYKKQSLEEEIAAGTGSTSKFIPGIKFTPGNKKTACSMLKIDLEKELINLVDLITVGELENFEDKNGSGSYRAAEGHDDIIMTCCQIPMAKQTLLYKDWLEDYELTKVQNNINRSWSMDNLPMDDNIWNF
jgi:hypothetical protein